MISIFGSRAATATVATEGLSLEVDDEDEASGVGASTAVGVVSATTGAAFASSDTLPSLNS